MKTSKNQGEECRNMAGPKIKETREKKGMTQIDLVKDLKRYGVEITACTLSKVETMKRSITDIELVAFTKALDTPIESLIDLD